MRRNKGEKETKFTHMEVWHFWIHHVIIELAGGIGAGGSIKGVHAARVILLRGVEEGYSGLGDGMNNTGADNTKQNHRKDKNRDTERQNKKCPSTYDKLYNTTN